MNSEEIGSRADDIQRNIVVHVWHSLVK